MKIRYRVTYARNGLNKDGKGLIQIELLQGNRRKYFSTKICVYPYQWDGMVINHPLANEYNEYILNERIRMEKIELDFLRQGKTPTLSLMKRTIKDNITIQAPFGEFVRSVTQHSSHRSKTTKDAYITLIKTVERFDKDTTIESIDIDWLNRFVANEKRLGMSKSTISGRLKSIRAIINEAKARKLIKYDDDPFQHFKIPKMEHRQVYLTLKELDKLSKLPLKGRERRIRDCALLGAYTGLRFGDLTHLKSTNLTTIKGHTWLVIKPHKTANTSGISCTIPIYSVFGGKGLDLINQYGSVERLVKVGNNASANRTLKDLVLRAGINKKVTFHIMRHTCITNLLSMGVPFTTVQRLVGQKESEVTLSYAHIEGDTIQADISKAFNTKK